MRVRVKFFAYTREITGRKEMEIDVKETARLGDILDILVEKFPALERYRDEIKMAINHEYAPLETALRERDEVAILPPVSGG